METRKEALQKVTELRVEDRITREEYHLLLSALEGPAPQMTPGHAQPSSRHGGRTGLCKAPPDFALAGKFLLVFFAFWLVFYIAVNRSLAKLVDIAAQLGAELPLMARLMIHLFSISTPLGWLLPLATVIAAFFMAYHPNKRSRWILAVAFLTVYPVLWYLGIWSFYQGLGVIPAAVNQGA